MTATEAARNFSEVLNRVAGGEEIEVVRNGTRVALISPPQARLIPAQRFRELIATAPAPDAGFVDDLRAARASGGSAAGRLAVLAKRGEVIGAHDLWIAATAAAHGIALATGNADEFRRVPGLRIISAPV